MSSIRLSRPFSYLFRVNLNIPEGDLPVGVVGAQYEVSLMAAGGHPPYRWAMEEGALPSGLELKDETGIISGNPDAMAKGPNSFTVKVTDATKTSVQRSFSLNVNEALTISRSINPSRDPREQRWIAELSAYGGIPPYKWELAEGSELPNGLSLYPVNGNTGACRINGIPVSSATTRFTVEVEDRAGQRDEADFYIKVRAKKILRRGSARINGLSIQVRPMSWWRQRIEGLRNITTWLLATLGVGVPTLGTIWVVIYSFSTPGPHWTYLGTATLTSLAAFLSGCLTGFLFGIPRVVSSGELRQDKGSSGPRYTPSSNLAEVSDWLTKLLLGAGLVQLTRLGIPIAGLIHNVAAGLYSPPGSLQTAEVLAGALLIGYAIVGLLDGYVVTTMWYQRQIAQF
jgi:Putative Ig domain